jgi:hypothetical protein
VTDAVNINKAYRRLFKVRRLLAAWTKEWGAFENWPEAIIDELHTHVEQEKVRIWRAKLIRKIREGKGFLYYVRTAFQRLPHDIDTVRDMWCMACELVQEIQAGVSCMEIHLGLEHEVVFKPVDQTVE